jgi:hypothetical protein
MSTENQNYTTESTSSQGDVIGSVVLLEWVNWESHFGNSWISIINGWSTNYAIWIDRENGKTKVSGMDRKHSEHNSVQEAKDWCQSDFTAKVKALIVSADL